VLKPWWRFSDTSIPLYFRHLRHGFHLAHDGSGVSARQLPGVTNTTLRNKDPGDSGIRYLLSALNLVICVALACRLSSASSAITTGWSSVRIYDTMPIVTTQTRGSVWQRSGFVNIQLSLHGFWKINTSGTRLTGVHPWHAFNRGRQVTTGCSRLRRQTISFFRTIWRLTLQHMQHTLVSLPEVHRSTT